MAISIWNRWLRCLRWWHSYKFPSGWLRRALWLLVILPLFGTDITAFALDLSSPPAAVGQATTLLLAVGDIADCNGDNHHTQTSALVNSLPGTVAILGDIAHPAGSPENFSECGELDNDRGIREFVVGTGGAPLRTFGVVQANSQVRNNQAWGVLQLSLSYDRYAWEFRPIAGQEFAENGSAFCVRVEGDWKTKFYLPLLYE